ncbi:MAG: type 4a pilus biogenesis protein PilO [Myxococcales bacterium]|nr:type 4a pilus biogenesis protein PilO [Myxococcales bacterium]
MSNTVKIVIILALVVLVFLAYFIFGFRVKQNEIDQADKQLAELTAQLNQVKAVAQVLQPIEREIETLNQQLGQSLAQLPEKKQIEALLISLDDLASASGLEINKVTPNAEVPRDFYAEIPIELEIKGGYHNIAIFFDKISKLKRVVNISNLKLSSPVDNNGEIQISANCIATTFRFLAPGETAVAAPAAPPPQAAKPKTPSPGDDMLEKQEAKKKKL